MTDESPNRPTNLSDRQRVVAEVLAEIESLEGISLSDSKSEIAHDDWTTLTVELTVNDRTRNASDGGNE